MTKPIADIIDRLRRCVNYGDAAYQERLALPDAPAGVTRLHPPDADLRRAMRECQALVAELLDALAEGDDPAPPRRR